MQGPKTGHVRAGILGLPQWAKGTVPASISLHTVLLGRRVEEGFRPFQPQQPPLQSTGVHVCRTSRQRVSVSHHLEDENDLTLSLAISRPIPSKRYALCRLTPTSWDLGQVYPNLRVLVTHHKMEIILAHGCYGYSTS